MELVLYGCIGFRVRLAISLREYFRSFSNYAENNCETDRHCFRSLKETKQTIMSLTSVSCMEIKSFQLKDWKLLVRKQRLL